ncbi:MAG TPA: hypothetical protein VEB00_10490 [Clostridia bacterium]|nr:hypothetical protein [Clostridia bacterium]
MLIQLVFQIVIMCTLAVIACIAYLSTVVIKNGGAGIPAYLYAYIIENLPLNLLLMVVLQMVFALMGHKVFFKHVSNHIIISLDILYNESLLLIFFCHTMKGYRDPLEGSLV